MCLLYVVIFHPVYTIAQTCHHKSLVICNRSDIFICLSVSLVARSGASARGG